MNFGVRIDEVRNKPKPTASKEESNSYPKKTGSINNPPKRSNRKVYVIATAVIAVLLVAIFFFMNKNKHGDIAFAELDTAKTESNISIAVSDQTQPSDVSADEVDPVISNLLKNMVYIEGGTYQMGSNDTEAYDDEKPVHQESVGSFHIGKYEVTQKEWKAVMGSNPSHFKGDNLPVENVSWDDCQELIKKLNTMTGKNFRLPTEAEWEYAARGGHKYEKPASGKNQQEVNEKLEMAREIRKNLTADPGNDKVLPANIGIKNLELESQIAQYNAKILERNKLRSISSSENPLVRSLDTELGEMRTAIIASLDTTIANLQSQAYNLQVKGINNKYSGSNDIEAVAWYDANAGDKTHTVGTKSPNELGLYDMTGNVYEWTSSHYSDNYNSPRNSSNFVCRGGSWGSFARKCRASYRSNRERTFRNNYLGLRLAL